MRQHGSPLRQLCACIGLGVLLDVIGELRVPFSKEVLQGVAKLAQDHPIILPSLYVAIRIEDANINNFALGRSYNFASCTRHIV